MFLSPPVQTPALHACALCAIWLLQAVALSAQTETTASLGGMIVAGDTKAAAAGARVVLRHAATGDAFATRANKSGQYLFTGLRPGEAHTIRVTAPGYDPVDVGEIILSLGEERQLDVTLSAPDSEIVRLETFVVTAAREHSQPGATTTFSQSEIENRPGIEETLNDFATSDPRVAMINIQDNEIAAAGQNFRFNSIQIDGIRMDDQFGLEEDGLPTLGNPFSMETVQAISVDLTPYQVSRGGFTGAAINAVSKSGANNFSGSAHYSYRNEKFHAAHPVTGGRTPFSNQKFGIMLSGPIVKNHLFFIVSWERTERATPPREGGFEPAPEDVARIVDIAREKYGYDAGSFYNPGDKSRTVDRYMAKLDWRINARHRLSVRYNTSRGDDPRFPDFGGSSETSLSSRWHINKRSLEGWNAQLFSQWHPSFQTETSFTQQTVKAEMIPFAPWPDVRINKVAALDGGDAGSLSIGTEGWYQENKLKTRNSQGRFTGTWLLGKHRVEFGAEQVSSRFENTYLRYAWGRYIFPDIDAFEAGTPSSMTFQYTYEGEIPTARWGYDVYSAFVQDTWRPIRSLTLTAGVRLDYTSMGDKPRLNPLFTETFGMSNQGTVDGSSTLGPRVSFRWVPARQLTLRGGAGLFQGRAPGVWLSNAFTNDGMSAIQTTVSNPGVTFDPGTHHRPPLDLENAEMPVNLMSPGLRLPAIIRGNIAADMRLPWQSMTATVEWLWSRSYNSLVYRNINLRQTATGPDGRPIYGTWTASGDNQPSLVTRSQLKYNKANGTGYDGPSFADVYMLTNADRDKDKSRASYLTFSLNRPVQNHWGFNLSYTRGHATEVSPVSNSTAHSNFSKRVSVDPNADETGTSGTEVRDRILAVLTFKFAPIRKCDTTLQLIYDGHTGRPYSFAFRTDINGDRAGDPDANAGSTFQDLFYVPAGPNDPKIYWASQDDKDRFFAYLATNDNLRRYAGRIVPRNSERSPFQHRVALRLKQQIPLRGKLRAEFVMDISNLPNLFDSSSGRYYQYSVPHAMGVASGHYDPRTNQYRYSFPTLPREPSLQTSASRWEIQAGVKVKF